MYLIVSAATELIKSEAFKESLSLAADISLIVAGAFCLLKLVSALLNSVSNTASLNFKQSIVLIISYIAALTIYFLFKKPWSDSVAATTLGQMGDFFGGMLNPILAFASFIALLYTIKLQSKEMSETREELKLTRIAQTNSAETASNQLVQQKMLVEYAALRDMLLSEIGKVSDIYSGKSGATRFDFILDGVINAPLSGNGFRIHQNLTHSFLIVYNKELKSSDYFNFFVSVQNAKRVFLSLELAATKLELTDANSSYSAISTQLASYCALASFTSADGMSILNTDNKALKQSLIKWFEQMDFDLSTIPELGIGQN